MSFEFILIGFPQMTQISPIKDLRYQLYLREN
jgi:hypothetical protein